MSELLCPDGFPLPAFWPKMLPKTQQDWLNHDTECLSLPHLWLEKTDSRRDVLEVEQCADCKVWFRWRGLLWMNKRPLTVRPAEVDWFCCACCAAKRGVGTEYEGWIHAQYLIRSRENPS